MSRLSIFPFPQPHDEAGALSFSSDSAPARSSAVSHVLVGLATLALAGCSSLAGKAGSSTESELIEPLSSPIALASENQNDTANTELPPVSWWQAFNDSQLNEAVELALAGNYSLHAAAARLDQSLASVRGSRSDYYPQVNAEVGKSRRWDGDDSTTDAWSAGVSASYELDLWGSIRAGAAQSQFTADASEAAYRTLANTVAGEVSTYWLGLRVQAERLRLLSSQKQRLETALQVIEGRKRRGQAALTDVWQQQKLVESLSVDIFAAEAQRDIYLQQLALWSGIGETSLADNEVTALAPIAQPSLTLSQVSLEALKARPDIQQAFAQLQAASAGVAVAVANRYPRLSLTASYTGSDSDLSRVFDNWVANIAGSLVLPLIDGAQRRAEVERQRAAEREALANYSQALLEAAQEVQQALVEERQYQRTLASLTEQLQLARKTLELQDYYYARGQIDFLDLLNAQQELLTLESQHLSARWNLTQARIQLFKAVSHGEFGDRDV